MQIAILRESGQNLTLSRMFLHHTGKALSHKQFEKGGLSLKGAALAIEQCGLPKESDWPYMPPVSRNDLSNGNVLIRPSPTIYKKARALSALSIPNNSKKKSLKKPLSIVGITQRKSTNDTIDFKKLLLSGHPIVTSIKVYDEFKKYPRCYNEQKWDKKAKQNIETGRTLQSSSNGVLLMPSAERTYKKKKNRNHAILLVGYNDDKQAFLGMNSWGQTWGIAPTESKAKGGFFWIPYDYILNEQSAAGQKLRRSNGPFYTPFVVLHPDRKEYPEMLEKKEKN